jgi:hypothetical protein
VDIFIRKIFIEFVKQVSREVLLEKVVSSSVRFNKYDLYEKEITSFFLMLKIINPILCE